MKKGSIKKDINALILVFLLICSRAVQAQQRILLSDFGARANSFENAATPIRLALAACAKAKASILVLPGGRIDVWPEGTYKKELYISNCTESDTNSKIRNIAFLLEGLDGFTLEGNNTLVVLHGKMLSYAIINSKNITVKELAFDYERPTMSELRINHISDTGANITMHPDSRYLLDNGRMVLYGEGWKTNAYHAILFDTVTGMADYSSFEAFDKATAVEEARGRIHFKGDFSKRNIKAGDVLTIRDPYRDNCGAFIWLSKNILITQVNMYYMHGLGTVSQFSENIRFLKVRVAPRPGSGRIVSSFADCFHFSGCRGRIELDSCLTSGSHDDPVNVHGTHLKIVSLSATGGIRVRFMHHQTYGFAAFFANDSIAFVDPETLQLMAYARVKKAQLSGLKEMELELEGQLPKGVTVGQCIENLTWTPEVSITNSRFERTNARGLLITTRRKVLISNNIFYKTGMHAILIADDAASWFESGPVSDVTIRDNVFEECGHVSAPESYVINIAPENHELVKDYYVHRNIHIINNRFILSAAPLLRAKSVDGLVFTGNTISAATLQNTKSVNHTFLLLACKAAVISNNVFNAPVTPIVQLQEMDKRQLKTDLKQVKQ